MNLLLTYRFYPISIGRYFKEAFLALGHTVWTAGTYSPTIPWARNLDYSDRLDVPDYEIPEDVFEWDRGDVLAACPFKPDAIISFDAGFHLVGDYEAMAMSGIPTGLVLTDPHVFTPPNSSHYTRALDSYEFAFCMQAYYLPLYQKSANGRNVPVLWLPYAASHQYHRWDGTDFAARQFDVCMISGSLHDPKRADALSLLESDLKCLFEKGLLFEDYANAYAQSVISFNRSTALDLPARFFEGLAQRNLVLTERVPDLECFDDMQEDVHYVAYDSLDEMRDKAVYYATHRDKAWEIASRGYGAWWRGNHTYLRRAEMILDVLKPQE